MINGDMSALIVQLADRLTADLLTRPADQTVLLKQVTYGAIEKSAKFLDRILIPERVLPSRNRGLKRYSG